MAGNHQSLIFTDQSDGESARKTEEMCEKFSQLHKTQPGQKLLEISRFFFKMSIHQMFGYPGLDAGLNASQFGGDIAFSIEEGEAEEGNQNVGVTTLAFGQDET